MTAIQDVSSNRRKQLLLMGVGALVGAAVGFAVMRAAIALQVNAKHMAWSDFLAVWLAVTFIGIALAMYVVSFNRRELAKNLEGFEATLPASGNEVRIARLQAIALALAGTLLLIPVLTMGSIMKQPYAPQMILVVMLVLFGMQIVVNVLLWRGADEFVRGQILQTCAITFAIGQGLLFLWASAEHLHLAPALTSWDSINLLLTLYVGAAAYTRIRSRA